jgi:HlyD family secretion protein
MLIVPNDDSLVVETRVAPSDIDQLQIGQQAILRLSAFSQTSTPEIVGTVQRISADLFEDTRTGASYYTVNIAISEDELSRLGSLKLVPGMPVEAFIQTAPRTALSYLTKPLVDQAARAFLEE